MYRKTPVGTAREGDGDEALGARSWRFLATCRKSRWSHVTINKTSANGMPTRTAWSTNSNQGVVPLKSQRPRECPASCRAEVSFTEITLLGRPLRLPLYSNSGAFALWRIHFLDTFWPQQCGVHDRPTRRKVTGRECRRWPRGRRRYLRAIHCRSGQSRRHPRPVVASCCLAPRRRLERRRPGKPRRPLRLHPW